MTKKPKIAGKHQQKNTHKKTYQTCSPLELAGWEKKVRKFQKKYEGNFGIRMIKVKMKKGKKWMKTTTYP